MRFIQFLIEETSAEDVPLNLEYHKRLNPDIWTSDTIRAKVRTALLKIAHEFYDFVEADESVKVTDIILTGSMANYNWTSRSDIDVHLIIDLKKSDDKCPVDIQDVFRTKKKIWMDSHDITVYGHPVEVYVQLADETVSATGIYSLTLNEWIDKPTRQPDAVNFDAYAVKVKAAEWITKINDAITSKADADTIKKIKEKIRLMRQTGLEQGGEFSIENLTFKTLRDNGYIEKLSDYMDDKQDRDLSLS